MKEAIDVDIVFASLAEISELARLRARLTDIERQRVDGYKVREPRETSLLARALLRTELARRVGVGLLDLSFDLRTSGKPDLRLHDTTLPDWRFSVSHTGPHVVIALVRGHDVGIDIERLDRLAAPLDIATRFFTPKEVAHLKATPQSHLHRTFFAGWTRKEAIVKARGITMAESLATLTVELDPGAQHPGYEDAPDVGERGQCKLTTFEIPDHRLMGAVAVLGEREPRLNLRMVSDETFD
ncbi:MAG: 4'-phosphopantetheinyl transferase superfamily protein [Vicinamibacteria bacterium]